MEELGYNVRIEPGLLQQFEAVCREFGMNATTVIDNFARNAVREKRIPTEGKKVRKVTPEEAMAAIHALREQARVNGLQDMTLEEINEEIRLARLEAEEKR